MVAVRFFMLVLVAASSHAGDWKFTPSLSVSETLTDNVTLDDTQVDGDLLTSLEPGASLTGRSRRLQVNADYRLQNRYYADHSDLNDMTNFLGSNAIIEAIEENLFVDFTAAMFPTQENTDGRLSNRNSRNTSENQVNVTSYGVSPRFIYRFGNIATVNADARISETSNSRATTDEVLTTGAGRNESRGVRLESGNYFSRYTWAIAHSQRSTIHEGGEQQDSDFESLMFDNNYRINRFFLLRSTVGSESNDFAGGSRFSGNDARGSGITWLIGGDWTPSPRMKIGGRFGKRSFGDSKEFNFSYRLRRIAIQGTYTEELSTSAEQLQNQIVFQRRDVFGNPIRNPNPDGNIPLPINNLGLTDRVFISRNFSSTLGFLQKRGVLSLNVYRTEQESSDAFSTQSNLGFGGNWNRRLNYRTTIGLQGDFQIRKAGELAENRKSIFVTPYVSYRIGPHLNSRLSYSYAEELSDSNASSDADPNLDTSDYVENAITGSLSYNF
jgi:uncharacterized protein (PEP-CTERM system associated)